MDRYESETYYTDLIIIGVSECPPPIGENRWERESDSVCTCSFGGHISVLQEYINRNKLNSVLFRTEKTKYFWSVQTGETITAEAFTNDVNSEYFPEQYFCCFELYCSGFSNSREECIKEIQETVEYLNTLPGIGPEDRLDIPTADKVIIVPVKRIKSINELPI